MLLALLACAQPELDVTVVSDPDPPIAGEVASTLTLTFSDGTPVTGPVEVVPWMPAHGHGISEDVVAEELEDGVYTTTFTYSMPGTWELQVTADDEYGVALVEVE